MNRSSRVAASLSAVVTLSCAPAAAQTSRDSQPAPAGRPVSEVATPAAARDVESLDAILGALYDVISGPAGRQPDWPRFRSLFAPGGRLIPTTRGTDGVTRPTVLTPDEFARRVAPGLTQSGFYEREIGRRTERFGAVVHVMSAYESKRAPADPRPFTRGVNSIQLLDGGDRWYVVTVFWDVERPGAEIPTSYLQPAAPER